MAVGTLSIAEVRQMFRNGETSPEQVLADALAKANSNAGQNVYLAQDQDWSREEARGLRREDIERRPLWGVSVSLKDCFDLEGFATSCGSLFYREEHGIASMDSWVAAKIRSAGGVITGKTHLHQLAYGITGENRDFGDCAQPWDAALLTGGSSSGAAASVQEGSALAAVGTDTGGSIRVPAALCGLAGYRSSITKNTDDVWRGGYHLAATFDTLGWLYRDLADGPLLGQVLLDLAVAEAPVVEGLRIGVVDGTFLEGCDADVEETFAAWQLRFQDAGARVERFETRGWAEAMEIYAPIQANEAAALHAGRFENFETAIAERLRWGASISAEEMSRLRQRLMDFQAAAYSLFEGFDFLLLPCAPMAVIVAGADHTETRSRILRYTSPMSLAGLPVVTLPMMRDGRPAGGIQLVGPMGSDAALLALSASFSGKSGNDARLHP
jgi:Asp-tRNA(Asn)/Glu-tRNA(Gln) amidotransferase A subunit family amidase